MRLSSETIEALKRIRLIFAGSELAEVYGEDADAKYLADCERCALGLLKQHPEVAMPKPPGGLLLRKWRLRKKSSRRFASTWVRFKRIDLRNANGKRWLAAVASMHQRIAEIGESQ